MSWKFVPSDDFDLDQLYEMKKFLESDLTASRAYLRQVQKDKVKYPSLDLTWANDAAKADIIVSKENLAKVKLAIDIANGKISEEFSNKLVAQAATQLIPEAKKKHWWSR